MRRNSLWVLGVIAAVAVSCSWIFAGGGETKIALDKAPAAVQAAVKKAVGENKLKSLSQETEDGKTVFEAEFDVNGVQYSVSMSESGQILEEETDVQVSDLPAPVRDAITKKYANGKIGDASLVKKDGKSFYEVDVAVGKDTHELKIAADGQLQSDHLEHEDHDGKADKD